MRSLLAGSLLFIAASASALPGDVAPPGAPDGVVDVSDVLLALTMATGRVEADLTADVAPFDPFGSRSLIRGDGAVDVADVLLLLRVAVGLTSLTGGFDLGQADSLDLVRSAQFSFEGLWAVLNGAITIEEVPPLNTPTEVDCLDDGSITILLTFSAQSIEVMDCDTGEFVINGLAGREGGLLDPVYDLGVTLSMVNGTGTLTQSGVIATEPEVEFEPGRIGSLIDSPLEVTSTYTVSRSFFQEAELINAEDRDWPIGRIWFSFPDAPGVEFVFDGTATARATVTGPAGTRTYSIALSSGVVTETF